MRAMGEGFSFYVVYGMVPFSVNPEQVEVHQVETQAMTMAQVEAFIRERLGREIVLWRLHRHGPYGGHSAIMNMKGYAGHYAWSAEGVRAYNLGNQVPNAVLIRKALEVNADGCWSARRSLRRTYT